jgi:hypothetical protein
MAAPTPVLFVPECYADTAVTLTLLRENRANHKRLLNFVSHGQGICRGHRLPPGLSRLG